MSGGGAFAEALRFLLTELGAERALVLHKAPGGTPQVAAVHNLDVENLWVSSPLSLTVLRRSLEQGEAVISADVATDLSLRSLWSLRMADIRSLVCVPYWGADGQIAGLLYADQRHGRRSYQPKDLDALQRHARVLENKLQGKVALPSSALTLELQAAQFRPLLKSSTRTAAPPAQTSPLRPDTQALCIFYRSLSMAMSAGIPLTRGLILAGQSGAADQRLAAISEGLSRRLTNGQALSTALQTFPRAFSHATVRLIRAAEGSGSLDRVLASLAENEEKHRQQQLRMRAVLIHPVLLLVLCLVMMVFGLPYMLEGQFRLIQMSGVEPPWLTRTVMFAGRCLPWILLGAAAVATQWRRLPWRSWVGKVPAVRKLQRLAAQIRFSQALGLQLKAGVGILEALPLACSAAGDSELEALAPQLVEGLTRGGTLPEALQACPVFSRSYLACIQAGEQVGCVDQVLEWTVQMDELELDSALATVAALAEPVIMAVMGCVVGILLIATLSPMVKVLQTL